MRNSWTNRLTSRKFLMTISGAIALIANKQYTEAASIIIAFILGESYIDKQGVQNQQF